MHLQSPLRSQIPIFRKAAQDLRLWVLAVLACLRTERYGYTLRQALAADGLEMEESTHFCAAACTSTCSLGLMSSALMK